MIATVNATTSLSRQQWGYERPQPGGIVVAVDGSPESIAALNTAAAIARTRKCALHAVTVLVPMQSYHINPFFDESRDRVDQLRIALKDAGLQTLIGALEPCEDWTHEVVVGRPAGRIAAIAEARAADLIVMGKPAHGVMDRVLGDETTLQVMRTSRIPVLAVPAETGRPRTIVVATDFSDASERAAKSAHALIPAPGTLYLAHVESSVVTVGETLTDGGRYPGDVVVWFRRLMDDLPSRSEVSIHPMLLSGNAPGAIMELADRVGADLIAAGSHGRNRLERFLLGSVSTGLVREARCAVLVAPPA